MPKNIAFLGSPANQRVSRPAPPSEFDEKLMADAYRRLAQDTKTVYRRKRGNRTTHKVQRWEWRLESLSFAHCRNAAWLQAQKEFDGEECLFFPAMRPGWPHTCKYNYKTMTAARAMLMMTQGLPDQPKAMATHKCGNGHLSCVNPKHLVWGNAKSNAQDRLHHEAPAKFIAGMDRDVIRSIKDAEKLVAVLAYEHGLPVGVVSAIKSGKMFRCVS